VRLVATFTAAMAGRIRNAEVLSEDGLTYAVHVGNEHSNLMAKVKETPSLTEALATARAWMDSITTGERT
jgi:hypothetical protein